LVSRVEFMYLFITGPVVDEVLKLVGG